MNQAPPDPRAPESQPTRQGRRLIRMLFRSNGKEGRNHKTQGQDNQPEDIVLLKHPTGFRANSEQPPPVPATTSKFASLKRKLFPSQNRRYPRHVPPLISPISALVKPSFPPLEENLKSFSRTSTSINDDENSDQNQGNADLSSFLVFEDIQMSRHLESDSQEDPPESDGFPAEGDKNWRLTSRRALIDDDDDRDLESAVEALDLESAITDKTLEEMNKAIDDLRAWKEAHQQKTQEALDMLQLEQEHQLHKATMPEDPIESEDLQLELKIQQQQRDREAQVLGLRKEAEAYQLECNLFKATLKESEAIRVEKALQNNTDSGGLALSRLRSELFQLDVKQRQESLMLELQGADGALDLNIANVQAFTGELDAILAQFDGDGVSAMAEDEDLII